ncbi:phosphoribosylamine--glycine ligase [Suttonella sp. R2A3]|uniref:phosphoribosylamine--glycine ligase n=1 Tax=Suttonella sp. R2A3 TaxID=2908648 RepID=UPI0038FC569A
MHVLIIGGGGREHAIAWKLSQDPRIGTIYVAPGNGGIDELERTENIALTGVDELFEFAKDRDIDLTFVGSEALLVEGIVDRFQSAGLTIFGPDQQAAQLEGSKAYAKSFMKKYGVKTAAYERFINLDAAKEYVANADYPLVIKASGLAAGKGVIICQNQDEAETALHEMMVDKRFGEAGEEIVIEAFLTGFEASILSFTDGKTILTMPAAKDHKTIGEGNTGENTGGMGVVCPHPAFSAEHEAAFQQDIVAPTLAGLQAEGMAFAGVIFFGLMINDDGVFLLEYNMRMGDPETQAILPLLRSPLLDPVMAAIEQRLDEITLDWRDKHAVCVVAAAEGYPGDYQTGETIEYIEQARFFSQVFLAGVKHHNDEYLTNGGRVLNVVGLGDSLEQARSTAYSSIDKIAFKGITYRRDIGE